MDQSVKAVFNDECGALAIDSRLVKRLSHYRLGFANRNDDHIAFFGGNLTGVHVVRFQVEDQHRWFDEILEADEREIEERIEQLPTINTEYHVSGSTMNLSCVWLLHMLMTSKLKDSEKHQALVDVLLVLQYKFLTSLLSHYFKYPAERGTAEATYDKLSGKFDLRQAGSWGQLLYEKSEKIISPTEGIHYQTIVKMDRDEKVVTMLNDIQGRLRDMLKNIYQVFMHVHQSGYRIASTSNIAEFDGEEVLKDSQHQLTTYRRYIHSVISDRNSFVRDEIVSLVSSQMPTLPRHWYIQVLEWMSNNYQRQGCDDIETLLNDVMTHSFAYMAENRSVTRGTHDLGRLIGRLKGVYSASRSNDPALFELRACAEKVVKMAVHTTNESVIAALRSAICLYIVCRALTMRYYSQGSAISV